MGTPILGFSFTLPLFLTLGQSFKIFTDESNFLEIIRPFPKLCFFHLSDIKQLLKSTWKTVTSFHAVVQGIFL